MVNIITIVDWAHKAIPSIKWALQRSLEFELEVIVNPYYKNMGNPYKDKPITRKYFHELLDKASQPVKKPKSGKGKS